MSTPPVASGLPNVSPNRVHFVAFTPNNLANAAAVMHAVLTGLGPALALSAAVRPAVSPPRNPAPGEDGVLFFIVGP
jgi:hypothetical protein